MIGYYVHHRGRGHLHRALCLAKELASSAGDVTGLSSLPRPSGWPGEWIRLPRDDDGDDPDDPTARGHLHWVPRHDEGLSARVAAVSSWLRRARPACLVSDVSVEVSVLTRLHGVPVVSVVLPGDRSDPAHQLGFGVSDLLVGFFPQEARHVVQGLTATDAGRLICLGALSRHPVTDPAPVADRTPAGASAPQSSRRTVVVLGGRGGGGLTADALARGRDLAPGWDWQALGGPCGDWVEDPGPHLRAATVVLTHAGEGAISEVAAARRPALVLPQHRPHGEQDATARALGAGPWPALVVEDADRADWPALLVRSAAMDGERWASWCDGGAASRFVGAVAPLRASQGAGR